MARFKIDIDKACAIKLDAENAEVDSRRRVAYQQETDPLMMEMIRGVMDSKLGRVPTLTDIEERVAEIKNRYPKSNLCDTERDRGRGDSCKAG